MPQAVRVLCIQVRNTQSILGADLRRSTQIEENNDQIGVHLRKSAAKLAPNALVSFSPVSTEFFVSTRAGAW